MAPRWPFFWFSRLMVTASASKSWCNGAECEINRFWRHNCMSFLRSGTVRVRRDDFVYSQMRSRKKNATTTRSAMMRSRFTVELPKCFPNHCTVEFGIACSGLGAGSSPCHCLVRFRKHWSRFSWSGYLRRGSASPRSTIIPAHWRRVVSIVFAEALLPSSS